VLDIKTKSFGKLFVSPLNLVKVLESAPLYLEDTYYAPDLMRWLTCQWTAGDKYVYSWGTQS